VDSTAVPPETHSIAYDASYRKISETQGARGTIAFAYQFGDRVSSVSVAGGPTAAYSYYPDGSVRSIEWTPLSGEFQFDYDLRGEYSEITLPNGQVRRFNYDTLGRATRLENLTVLGGILASYDFTYDISPATQLPDAIGLLTERVATVPALGLLDARERFAYDADGRLLRADYPSAPPFNGEVDEWSYDLLGNRLSSSVNGAVTNYSYASTGGNPQSWNRLMSDGVNGYTYDSNGSVLSITSAQGTETFSWDYEGRSIAHSRAGDSTENRFDYRGRRAFTRRNGSSSEYLFRGDTPLRVGGDNPADFLVGPLRNELLAVVKGAEIFFPVLDERDSIVALTDTSGSVRLATLYDVWGSVRQQDGDIQSPLGHLGREMDTAGLWLNDARYYNPSIGRFLQEDPGGIDDSTGRQWARILDSARPGPEGPPRSWEQDGVASFLPRVNRTERSYAYGRNNPLAFSDPGGRYWVHTLVTFVSLSYHMVKQWDCNESVDICFIACTTQNCNFCRNPHQDGDPLGKCFVNCHTHCRQEVECYWEILWLPIEELKLHWILKWVPAPH
jgi:RHS repeat-associated protein